MLCLLVLTCWALARSFKPEGRFVMVKGPVMVFDLSAAVKAEASRPYELIVQLHKQLAFRLFLLRLPAVSEAHDSSVTAEAVHIPLLSELQALLLPALHLQLQQVTSEVEGSFPLCKEYSSRAPNEPCHTQI